MPKLAYTTASLRFSGDDLDPAEISKRLGHQPTDSELKGDECAGTASGKSFVAQSGGWRLKIVPETETDLNTLVLKLLDMLTDKSSVWKDLTTRYDADIYCGLFMATGNDSLSLPPSTLKLLGDRGLGLEFDIYDSKYKEAPSLLKSVF